MKRINALEQRRKILFSKEFSKDTKTVIAVVNGRLRIGIPGACDMFMSVPWKHVRLEVSIT